MDHNKEGTSIGAWAESGVGVRTSRTRSGTPALLFPDSCETIVNRIRHRGGIRTNHSKIRDCTRGGGA